MRDASSQPADGPALADRIVALAQQHLFNPDGEADLGVVGASLLGRGESYAAWLLQREDEEPLVLRVARRPLADMPRVMAHEFAALLLVPDEVGVRGLAMSDDPANPLGFPWVLSTYARGSTKAVEAWTALDVTRSVETMARLHAARPSRVCGPVGEAVSSSFDLLADFDAGWAWWSAEHPQITSADGVPELHAAVRTFLVERAEDFDGLEDFALIHGDLVTTNVVFDDGIPRFIDWEWAEYGDVAKDLALLGGRVHGGPWYVPMDDAAVAAAVQTYATTITELGGHVDAGALRRRRDSWEVHERFQSSLYFAHMAAQADGRDDVYAPAVAVLRSTLAARVGEDRRGTGK